MTRARAAIENANEPRRTHAAGQAREDQPERRQGPPRKPQDASMTSYAPCTRCNQQPRLPGRGICRTCLQIIRADTIGKVHRHEPNPLGTARRLPGL